METWLHWEARGTLPLGSGGWVELWRWLKFGARVMFQVDKRAYLKIPQAEREDWCGCSTEIKGALIWDEAGELGESDAWLDRPGYWFFGLLQPKGMALNYLRQRCVCIRSDGYGGCANITIPVLWKPCPGCSVEDTSQSSNRILQVSCGFSSGER